MMRIQIKLGMSNVVGLYITPTHEAEPFVTGHGVGLIDVNGNVTRIIPLHTATVTVVCTGHVAAYR